IIFWRNETMTDVLVMKRSSLVLPNGFVEIDREEMSYVEGGLYLDNSTCIAIVATVANLAWIVGGVITFAVQSATVAAGIVAATLQSLFLTARSLLTSTLPGAIIASILSFWYAINSETINKIGVSIGIAAFTGQGVSITGWFKLSCSLG
ncbi:MAG: hypothetical protein LBQ27_00800, partial [Clostridiales bacterium]|nr:hypothetical protein [Clostridiales bacterium]